MIKEGPMKLNLGTLDRTIRLLIAVAVAALYITHAISGTLALVLAVIFLVTSLVSWCPVYALLGLSTRKGTAAPGA